MEGNAWTWYKRFGPLDFKILRHYSSKIWYVDCLRPRRYMKHVKVMLQGSNIEKHLIEIQYGKHLHHQDLISRYYSIFTLFLVLICELLCENFDTLGYISIEGQANLYEQKVIKGTNFEVISIEAGSRVFQVVHVKVPYFYVEPLNYDKLIKDQRAVLVD